MSIPDLHEVVLAALDLHASYDIPELRFEPCRRRAAIASGNALPTGRILFADESAVYANEGEFERVLDREREVDSAVVLSASGTKHAPKIIDILNARGLRPYLVTCNARSPAAERLPRERVFETRSNPEPITYNTSTYLGMILAKTRESPGAIQRHILERVAPLVPDFGAYQAFYLMVPPEYEVVREMFITKFDELFGGRITGRCYTTEQTMHAKTVVPWEKELFVSLGCANRHFGMHRLEIPLPDAPGFAAMIATGYYVIGRLQSQRPPWFKEHAEEYARTQQELFEELARR
jgi:hypothetical protein